MLYTKIVNFFASLGLVISVFPLLFGVISAIKFLSADGALERSDAYSSMMAALIIWASIILPSALMGVLVDISHSVAKPRP